MQENFLHYIWQYKKFSTTELRTATDEILTLIHPGQHNLNGGPDFFNAQIKIGNQFWAGNVEIHVNASDWYVHNHEVDPAYDNVILHVVFENDTDIYRKDNSIIPTLELKNLIAPRVFEHYRNLLLTPHKWINCENDFATTDDFIMANWLERLYIERLERKSEIINDLLKKSKNDWEAVLFQLLAKNFGLKVNGDAFFSMTNSFDFSVVRKLQSDPLQLEALFFGQAGLLDKNIESAYYLNLQKEYQFLKQKFKLSNDEVISLQFFRLRPPNFPTIRLSQFAMCYHLQPNLFSKLRTTDTLDGFYNLFQVPPSDFWRTHYTFEKESRTSKKVITKNFVDLLLINTVLPLKFCYDRAQGERATESSITMAHKIAGEENSIIKAFNLLKKMSNDAFTSQALIQLKTNYCDNNRCMECAVGNSILGR